VLTQYDSDSEMEEIALFLCHQRVIGNAFDSLMRFYRENFFIENEKKISILKTFLPSFFYCFALVHSCL
jgi:hypothetical protein